MGAEAREAADAEADADADGEVGGSIKATGRPTAEAAVVSELVFALVLDEGLVSNDDDDVLSVGAIWGADEEAEVVVAEVVVFDAESNEPAAFDVEVEVEVDVDVDDDDSVGTSEVTALETAGMGTG